MHDHRCARCNRTADTYWSQQYWCDECIRIVYVSDECGDPDCTCY